MTHLLMKDWIAFNPHDMAVLQHNDLQNHMTTYAVVFPQHKPVLHINTSTYSNEMLMNLKSPTMLRHNVIEDHMRRKWSAWLRRSE